MLKTDTHTHTRRERASAKNMIFGFRRPQKRVNPSKSPFRKFDREAVLSLPCMGKEK